MARVAVWLTASMLCASGSLADAPLGVTATGNETRFAVWAPNAQSVQILGDFNGWKTMQDNALAREGAAGVWSATKPRSLPTGDYQFLINGNLHRRDPYARAVSPNGKNSRFYDPAACDWNDARAPALPLEDLVIYELHVGTFNDPAPRDGKPGTFYDALRRLDALQDLGINCIELMPVHEFEGMHSWGYNPCDLFAVEQAYGGPDGLKTFVQACHRRGIAVHLDIVHNHYGPDHLDLLQFDGTGTPTEGGIYFYSGPNLAQTPWGPRVKFDEPMVRRFITDKVRMWLDEYRVDGVRWDSPSNIRACNYGADPIAAGLQMLEDINGIIRSRYPHVISIAEDSMDQGGFHASWDFDFHHQVVPVLAAPTDAARDIFAIASAGAARYGMARVIYVDNHDEAGKINGQQRLASDVDSKNPDSDYARRLCGLGAVLTFTSAGIPLLFMGNEMQESGTFHDDRPLDWGKRTSHAGLVALHKDLIALRRNLNGYGNALKGQEIETPLLDAERHTLAYWRWHATEPERRMVIAINLSSNTQAVAVPFPNAGPWFPVINTDSVRYDGKNKQEKRDPFQLRPDALKGQITLAPYSAMIFAPAKPAAGAAAGIQSPIVKPLPAKPDPAKPAFSMYATINITGDFNNWHKTADPLKSVADYQWSGVVRMASPTAVRLRVSANEDGRIYWGAHDEAEIALPCAIRLKRLGTNIVLRGPLDGRYQFAFNEDSLELSIQPAPEPQPQPLRTWTDSRGRTLQARFVSVSGATAIMERANGESVRVPLNTLSEADRNYIQSQ